MKKKKREQHERKSNPKESSEEEFVIVGKNPVREALRSDLQVERILILQDSARRFAQKFA